MLPDLIDRTRSWVQQDRQWAASHLIPGKTAHYQACDYSPECRMAGHPLALSTGQASLPASSSCSRSALRLSASDCRPLAALDLERQAPPHVMSAAAANQSSGVTSQGTHSTWGLVMRRRMGRSEMPLLVPVSRSVSDWISSRMRSSSKKRLLGQCRNSAYSGGGALPGPADDLTCMGRAGLCGKVQGQGSHAGRSRRWCGTAS